MTEFVNEPAVAYNHFNSIEEFLAYVEPLQAKYEFWGGQIVMMAGSTQGHALIRDNVSSFLKKDLTDRGCTCFQETVYLRIKNEEKILFLPDVMVTCDPLDFNINSMFVQNPSIIVEILSDSTSSHDRGEKWEHYRKIPSLKYYILVSQKKPIVEVFGRPHAQSLFYFESFEGLDSIVDLREMDIIIPMKEIYERIDFEQLAKQG